MHTLYSFTLRVDGNETEVFNVTRADLSSLMASRCVTTDNRADSYESILVRERSEDGSLGDLALSVEMESLSFEEFNDICSLPPREYMYLHICHSSCSK